MHPKHSGFYQKVVGIRVKALVEEVRFQVQTLEQKKLFLVERINSVRLQKMLLRFLTLICSSYFLAVLLELLETMLYPLQMNFAVKGRMSLEQKLLGLREIITTDMSL